MEYYQIIVPILCLTVNILFHIAFCRYSSLGMLKSVIAGFMAGFFCILLFEYYLHIKIQTPLKYSAGITITNLIIYIIMGYGYFHFVNLGETARRIRILKELYYSKDGLTADEILNRYNADMIVSLRLERLLKNKQIIYSEGRYITDKPAVLLMAKIIVMLKLIILGKRSEFS